ITPDTNSTGALQIVGANRFTVASRGPARAEFANVQTTIYAGDTLATFTLRFYDAQNNATDVGIRPVIVTGTSYRDTLALTRIQTGVYEAERVCYTTSGTFTITPLGISAVNMTGERVFTVIPRTASRVVFTSLLPSIVAGNLQSRFRATLYDRFNNLSDSI